MTECPHCGQAMLMKFGVRLTRQQAAILDMIEQTTIGRGGIALDALGWTFYPGVSKTLQGNRIKVHVNQINDQLAATDWRIVGPGCGNRGGVYRLIETKSEAA